MSKGCSSVRRITKGVIIVFFLCVLISGWIDIPNKLSFIFVPLKAYIPEEWSWGDKIIDVIKYSFDKVGWALILFIIQKQYDKHALSCIPVKCTLLTPNPTRYDSRLLKSPSNKTLRTGFGRYYYDFKLKLDAESNKYYNLSIKKAGFNELQLDTLGESNKTIVIHLTVYCDSKKVIGIFPIVLTLFFSDTKNTRYKERIIITKKRGMYFCNIRTPQKY